MAKKAQNPGPAPGKRRVTTVEETVEEGSAGEELTVLEPGEDDEGGDFMGVLADLAGGAEVRCEIRRTSPSDFAGYCCTYALSEMSLDRLQSEWGGGKFSVRLRAADGSFKGSTNIQIAGRAKNRDDAPPVVSAAPAAPAIDLSGIVTAINAANQGQVTMLTELVKGLIARPEPKVEKGPDVLEVVTALAPILKPDKSGGDPGDAIKLLMQGIELGKDLAGGGGGGDDFTNLALKGMDMVKSVAANQPRQVARPVQRRAPPRPALAAPGSPAPGTVVAEEAAPAVEAIKQDAPPMLKLLGWIKQQAALLVHQAKRKKSPELYAELFLDNVPDGVSLETIYEQMAADDAVDKLAEITGNAEVLQHRAWFEEFRQEVLDQLVDDGEEEQAAANAADRIEEAQPGDGGGGGES